MKLTKSKIRKYNNIASKNKKPVMARVGHVWYTWLEGANGSVFLTTKSGRDIEFNYNQINDIRESITKISKTKSTQNAIDVDDEDDEVKEAYKVDIDKLLQNPKIKKLMKRLNIRKSQSQQGAIQLLNYFATNPHALAAFKKLAVGESMAAPFRRRKSRGLGRPMKVGLNESSWSQPLGWSSPEAKVHVDKDITKMSKHLGKTSHDIIKIMMSGVKGDKYDAMDLQRGMKEGDVRRTHYGEMDFIQELWHKVRDGFRRYSKRGKLR